jgi:transcriptional regulator of arginine metabolism
MMHKHSPGDVMRRRDEILSIVREISVHSQDQLISILRKRGLEVTQPTLSRDLKELGLAKTPSGYVAPRDIAATPASVISFAPKELREERLNQLLRDLVISAEAAGTVVVIRTPAAAAQPLASALDGAALTDVLGTIGGDDTIFVALRHTASASALARRIQGIASLGRRATRS